MRCPIIVPSILFYSVAGIISAACSQVSDSSQTIIPQELTIRYAAELNQVPVGCRTIAMGNTGVVLPYSSLAAYWNPAHSAFVHSLQTGVEGAKLYGGMSSLGTIAFSVPVQSGLSAGIMYKVFFPDLINEYDSLPGTLYDRQYNYRIDGYQSKGSFHNNQHSIIATIAKMFSLPLPRPVNFALPLPVDIGFGLNIKSLVQTMTPGQTIRMGYNINIDLGMLCRIGVDYDLAQQSIRREVLFALAYKDIIPTKMTWLHSNEGYEEPVDYSQFYGMSYIDRSGFLFADWTVALSLHKLYDVSLHAGLEGVFFNMVAFRCGISDGVVTLGTGVHYKKYSIDYAFTFDEIDYSLVRLAATVEF